MTFKTTVFGLLAILACLGGAAGETAGRKMAWAHYVPWYDPVSTSQATEIACNYPLTGKEALKLRHRVWPGSSATIRFFLNPALYRGKPQSVIFNQGWTDGISVNLLPNSRLAARMNQPEAGKMVLLTPWSAFSPGIRNRTTPADRARGFSDSGR